MNQTEEKVCKAFEEIQKSLNIIKKELESLLERDPFRCLVRSTYHVMKYQMEWIIPKLRRKR